MFNKFRLDIISVIFPVIFLIYGIFTKETGIILNSGFTLLLLFAIIFINKKCPVLSTGTYYWVILFVLLSVFLGRGLRIYFLIPHWDKFLHFISGFILASAGYQVYTHKGGTVNNKLLMGLFVFTFAAASAGIWEIYEFILDCFFNMNCQNGSLNDTMWDIILGTASAFITAIFYSSRQ